MACMVTRKVFWRCLIASMNHLAASTFPLDKGDGLLLGSGRGLWPRRSLPSCRGIRRDLQLRGVAPIDLQAQLVPFDGNVKIGDHRLNGPGVVRP